MTHTHTLTDYDYYNNRHRSTHNRKCIDGRITSSGKCVAYCEYAYHPGFLTAEQKAARKCEENNCMYLKLKTRRTKQTGKAHNESDLVISAIVKATSDMEGFKVMRAVKGSDGIWIAYYVTIAGYSLDEAVSTVEAQLRQKVIFSKLEYDFDVAASIIFNQKMSA